MPKELKTKKCPFCSETILFDAKKCRYCGEILDEEMKKPARYQKVWSPGLAAILSLIIPGAGQVYKGKLGAGLLWFIAVIVGYALVVIPGLILHIICISNAYKQEPS